MFQPVKVKSPWSQMAIFLGLLATSFFVYGILSTLVLKGYGLSLQAVSPVQIDWSNPRHVNILKGLQALSSLIIFLVPAYAFSRLIYSGNYAHWLGFRSADRLNMYVLAGGIIFFAFPVVFWLGQWNEQLPLPHWLKQLEVDTTEQMKAFLRNEGVGGVILNVILIALLPAIGEEVCFRSILQRIIIQITRKATTGILVTAFIFSALHFQFEGFLPRMFLGFMLGYLYWYSGSIWTSMLAHFVNNAVQVVVVSYAPQYISETPVLPLLLVITSGVTVAAILWFYQQESRQSFTLVYGEPGDPV